MTDAIPPAPVVAVPAEPKQKSEERHMQKLQALSGEIWSATRWLLTLVGGGVLFTIGFQSATAGGLHLSEAAILAAVAVLVAALSYGLISIMTASRIDWAKTKKAPQPRGVAYTILWIALTAQVLGLLASAPLQGWAVYAALQAADPQLAANAALIERLKLYSADPQALTLVVDFCMKNESSAPETPVFLKDCLLFLEPEQPTQAQAATIAASPDLKTGT